MHAGKAESLRCVQVQPGGGLADISAHRLGKATSSLVKYNVSRWKQENAGKAGPAEEAPRAQVAPCAEARKEFQQTVGKLRVARAAEEQQAAVLAKVVAAVEQAEQKLNESKGKIAAVQAGAVQKAEDFSAACATYTATLEQNGAASLARPI